MTLIPDWRQAWRYWSVRLNLIGLLFLAAEAALPLWGYVTPEARAALPRWLAVAFPLICFSLATVARIIRQSGIKIAARDEQG